LTDKSLQSADKDQQEMRAVAQKPHDSVANSIVSKCTAVSRGPPCDSTALVVAIAMTLMMMQVW